MLLTARSIYARNLTSLAEAQACLNAWCKSSYHHECQPIHSVCRKPHSKEYLICCSVFGCIRWSISIFPFFLITFYSIWSIRCAIRQFHHMACACTRAPSVIIAHLTLCKRCSVCYLRCIIRLYFHNLTETTTCSFRSIIDLIFGQIQTSAPTYNRWEIPTLDLLCDKHCESIRSKISAVNDYSIEFLFGFVFCIWFYAWCAHSLSLVTGFTSKLELILIRQMMSIRSTLDVAFEQTRFAYTFYRRVYTRQRFG